MIIKITVAKIVQDQNCIAIIICIAIILLFFRQQMERFSLVFC